jgi:PAS domain S-box-containing protein
VETLLERTLALTQDAVVANDASGRIHVFNAAAERLFGYRHDEALAWVHVSDLFHRASDARRISHALQGSPDHVETLEVEARGRGGDVLPVRLAVTRVHAADGTPLVLGIASDRREVLGLLARLEDATGQVVASERRAAGMQVAALAERDELLDDRT